MAMNGYGYNMGYDPNAQQLQQSDSWNNTYGMNNGPNANYGMSNG